MPDSSPGTTAVYPRVCGGTQLQSLPGCVHGGLSPRVRGNLLIAGPPTASGGSIPACAGEPALDMPIKRWYGVYPRVCGGTPYRPFPNRSPNGSIPACAGEPIMSTSMRPSERVYPRVCGGTSMAGLVAWQAYGLSPRVRGNRNKGRSTKKAGGSIPACAGEPIDARIDALIPTVYPRVCGGTYTFTQGWPHPPGSIPACAGEPLMSIGLVIRFRVYPRVCGGTDDDASDHDRNLGLSPRVRGNLSLSCVLLPCLRSIPACAGEPPKQFMQSYRNAVYPRVCGGTPRMRRS